MKREDKARRQRDGMEELPQVLVEEILQRLGVKSLVRFTSVSKQWYSTIKSPYFASRHLIRARSRDPDILLGGPLHHEPKPFSCLRTFELGSSEFKNISIIPKPNRFCLITRSCDGLVCVYDFLNILYLINPATRWSRPLPKAKVQKINRLRLNLDCYNTFADLLGFGKDSMTGKYKMVWLYNSSELGLDGQTTCEVFDFSTNTWRNVVGSTHRVLGRHPVNLDGSLHWLTSQYNGETKIVYFYLHTEVFQVMSETPIVHASPCQVDLCSLNNHLCVSEKKSNSQEIWSLNSNKVWEKTYSINLSMIGDLNYRMTPVTLFNKTELLFLYEFANYPCLFVQDTRIGSSSYTSCYSASDLDQAISFIPSLISI